MPRSTCHEHIARKRHVPFPCLASGEPVLPWNQHDASARGRATQAPGMICLLRRCDAALPPCPGRIARSSIAHASHALPMDFNRKNSWNLLALGRANLAKDVHISGKPASHGASTNIMQPAYQHQQSLMQLLCMLDAITIATHHVCCMQVVWHHMLHGSQAMNSNYFGKSVCATMPDSSSIWIAYFRIITKAEFRLDNRRDAEKLNGKSLMPLPTPPLTVCCKMLTRR